VNVFGDSDPEDAWQIDDPIPVLIDNLARRLQILDPAWRLLRWGDELEQISILKRVLGRVRGRVDVDQDWRVDLIAEHVQVVLERIGAGNG
jgi:hypothetical protein